MWIGRANKSGDILFGDSSKPSLVSSGGVLLARQATDDYVRFRLPDTSCPPLPEPSVPLDSGVADEAEPNRWQVAGNPNTANRWQLLQSRDTISLAYTVYGGDFTLEFESRVVGYTGTQNGAYFDGVVVEFTNGVDFIRAGFGMTPGGRGYGWRRIIGGQESKNIGPAVLTDVLFRAQVQRAGSAWSARFWRGDDGTWTSWIALGNGLTGSVNFSIRGERFNMVSYGTSTRDVTVEYHYFQTLSGAPSSVTVATPVIDLGTSIKAQPRRLPEIGVLEWRASDTPFGQNDSSPAWNNPAGEFRYWQARVTWTEKNYLLERIELIAPYLILEFVMLRNRFTWLAHTNQNPVVVPFRPIAASHRIGYIQQVTGGYEVSFSEQVDEYWLILQE